MLVVAAGRDQLPEDVAWLPLQPYRSVVMSKGNRGAGKYHIAEDKGNEASLYLRFLIMHYDDLPAHMFFMHAHNGSWHLRVRAPCEPLHYDVSPV